jgi:phosphopentomutase
MLITGDHGCDPTLPSTDHSRERAPLLAAGVPGGPHDLGERNGFSDLGATVADLLGVEIDGPAGTPFTAELGL